jgi:ribosome-associated translation inhibitor RaiA
MTSPFKQALEKSSDSEISSTTDDVTDVSPEVKSYIYQTIMEFEPFSTPQTVVAVIAKDPLKLHSKTNENGEIMDRSVLKDMHRISITLSEEGSKIEDEGLHEDIFTAIRIAKDKLVKKLIAIQDQVISNQDRKVQINNAIGGHLIH